MTLRQSYLTQVTSISRNVNVRNTTLKTVVDLEIPWRNVNSSNLLVLRPYCSYDSIYEIWSVALRQSYSTQVTSIYRHINVRNTTLRTVVDLEIHCRTANSSNLLVLRPYCSYDSIYEIWSVTLRQSYSTQAISICRNINVRNTTLRTIADLEIHWQTVNSSNLLVLRPYWSYDSIYEIWNVALQHK